MLDEIRNQVTSNVNEEENKMGNYILNGSGIKKRLGKYILYKHVFQKLYTFD